MLNTHYHDLVLSIFGILSQAIAYVLVQLPQMVIQMACPNMILAVNQDVKSQLGLWLLTHKGLRS